MCPLLATEKTGKNMYVYFGVAKKRWVVERSFSWLKRKCRRLLMRRERLPEAWNTFSLLGLIFMWLEILLGYVPEFVAIFGAFET